MNRLTVKQLQALLPRACTWAQEQEESILRQGVPLSMAQSADARLAGVRQPDRVRLLSVDRIPVPADPILAQAALATGLLTPMTIGLTLRYGIFIRADHWGNRRLIAHELAHTAQYERLGGFLAFLEAYLHECVTIGYPAAPMEQEAVAVAKRICG